MTMTGGASHQARRFPLVFPLLNDARVSLVPLGFVHLWQGSGVGKLTLQALHMHLQIATRGGGTAALAASAAGAATGQLSPPSDAETTSATAAASRRETASRLATDSTSPWVVARRAALAAAVAAAATSGRSLARQTPARNSAGRGPAHSLAGRAPAPRWEVLAAAGACKAAAIPAGGMSALAKGDAAMPSSHQSYHS